MKRETIIETLQSFPSNVDLNDLFEKLIFMEKVAKGLEQIEKGETVPHEKVVATFRKKWKK